MSAGAAFAAWTVETLIATTLLIALVMALRGPVRRLFGPQVAYALWALPALRMILPPLPEDWRAVATTPISRASDAIVTIVAPSGADAVAGAAMTEAAAVPAIPLAALLGVGWAIGAALFFTAHLWRHASFCRRIVRSGEPIDRIARVRIIASPAAPGPLAFGLLRRYVAFPSDFAARYDADERDLALAHELGHHARGDLVANWVALAMLAIHWFNPLAWRAFHAFRADQEMANDARVLSGRPLWQRHAYACAIVKAAHGGAVSAACHLHSVRDLKGRIKMLTTDRTSRRRLAGGAGAVGLLALATLGLTASGTHAAELLTEKVGATIGVDLPRTPAVVAVPVRVAAARLVQAPPAPPAPPTHGSDHAPPAPPVPPAPPAPAADPAARPAPAPAPGAAPLPPVPPAPPAPLADGRRVETIRERVVEDGRVRRDVHRVIVRRRDGTVMSEQAHDRARQAAEQAMRAAPRVSGEECDKRRRGAPAGTMVLNRVEGGRRTIIVCTDRIARVSAEAAETARAHAVAKRVAMAQAMEGLRAARRAIEAERHMTEAARRAALAGLEASLAEMEAEAHDPD